MPTITVYDDKWARRTRKGRVVGRVRERGMGGRDKAENVGLDTSRSLQKSCRAADTNVALRMSCPLETSLKMVRSFLET